MTHLTPEYVRFINLYPPCHPNRDPHPWRTTSWNTYSLAHRNIKHGQIALVKVHFLHGEGIPGGPPIGSALRANIKRVLWNALPPGALSANQIDELAAKLSQL